MTADSIFVGLLLAFVIGLGGWLAHSAAWLWLCVPFVLAVVGALIAARAVDKFFKGLRLW